MITQQESRARSRRNKPTDGGAMIQTAREDAGLTREELARRYLLANHYIRTLNYPIVKWRLCLDDSWIEYGVKSLRREERTRLYEPHPSYVSMMLALIDAGPAGTSDEEVLEAWREYVAESQALELDSLREVGENFADAVIRARDDGQHLGWLMTNFFDQTLPDVQHRQFTNVRYIENARDVALKAALARLSRLGSTGVIL